MLLTLTDALYAALAATGTQIAILLGPSLACALVLAQLERLTSLALVRAFGWRAVLGTGWIGVPIHELSHVAACLFFSHEIEEVKLFAPDPETGSLGFVRHRAPVANPWAELGRFFIGVAPLVGGSLALVLAAHVLLPDAELALLARPESLDAPARAGVVRALEAARALLAPERLASPRFWLFLYVATAIGAHLAPSRADLRGALRGGIALLALWFLLNLGLEAAGAPLGADALAALAAWTTPVVALLALAVVLCAAVLVLALLVSSLAMRARGLDGASLSLLAREHWSRLALMGIGGLALAMAAGVIPWWV